VTIFARSSVFRASSSRKRNITRARSGAGVSRQAGNALAAACTVRSISAGSHRGVRAMTSPVEGFQTSAKRSAAGVDHWPAIRFGQV
jgi:hypothetical protein